MREPEWGSGGNQSNIRQLAVNDMMQDLVKHPRFGRVPTSQANLDNWLLDDDYGGLLLGGEQSLFNTHNLSSTLNSTNQSTLFTKNFVPMTDPRKPLSPNLTGGVQQNNGFKPT